MLTSVGRASARRVLFARASSKLPLASRVLALRPASRSFTVSRATRSPDAATAAEKASTAAAKKQEARAVKKATTGAKKPVAKKKPAAKKPAAKKPKAKPKAKKVVIKKPKKPKKVLTPEEANKVAARELKKVALLKEHPSVLGSSAWRVYVSQNVIKGNGTSAAAQMPNVASGYKALSSSAKEVGFTQAPSIFTQI